MCWAKTQLEWLECKKNENFYLPSNAFFQSYQNLTYLCIFAHHFVGFRFFDKSQVSQKIHIFPKRKTVYNYNREIMFLKFKSLNFRVILTREKNEVRKIN